jgi:hypothetical protein
MLSISITLLFWQPYGSVERVYVYESRISSEVIIFVINIIVIMYMFLLIFIKDILYGITNLRSFELQKSSLCMRRRGPLHQTEVRQVSDLPHYFTFLALFGYRWPEVWTGLSTVDRTYFTIYHSTCVNIR